MAPNWNRVAWIIVLVHLACLVVHTAAHVALSILPQPLDLVFILAVMYVLPPASAAFLRRTPRAAWAYLAAFAASFSYGAISHFAIPGPDNALGLAPGGWAATFQGTTFALAVIEALGLAAGLALVARLRTPSAPAGRPA